MEVLNARSTTAATIERTEAFAKRHKIVQGAGSDAHSVQEIGNAYVMIPEFSGKDEFLKSLARGEIFGQRSSPLVHLYSTLAKVKSKISKLKQ